MNHFIRHTKSNRPCLIDLKHSFFATVLVLVTASFAFGASATLSWDANTEPDLSGYKVYIGTASGSYDTPVSVGNVTTYAASGLADGSYFFAVTAIDTSGNESGFSNEVLKMISATDGTPPLLSDISAATTSSSATISWVTNEASDTQVQYGTSTAYGVTTTLNAVLSTSHSETLSGLKASTFYHYRVLSRDAAGNLSTSADNTFTTASAVDTVSPHISGVLARDTSTSGTVIVWTTDVASDAQVEYGTTSAYGTTSTLDSSLATGHLIVLDALSSDTLYHFRVLSIAANGLLATSADYTFKTRAVSAIPADTTAPSDVVNASALAEDGSILLSWTNPTDSDFVGVRIRFRTDHFPTDVNDGTLLGDISGKPNQELKLTHGNLSNGVSYFYLVAPYDGSGNFQATVFVSAAPKAATGPPEEPSDEVGQTSGGGGGGCGIIRPGDGGPPGPGDSAGMLTLIGFILLVLLKKSSRLAPVRIFSKSGMNGI